MNKIETLDKINNREKYFGEVVELGETYGLVKVKVISIFDDIPTEYIPFANPRYLDGQSHDLPFIGEMVYVKFIDNDLNYPQWYRMPKEYISPLEKEDYKSGSILFEKDLSKYDLDGYLSLYYSKSDGLVFSLKRNENLSKIVIDNDNTVLFKNGNSKQVLHIAEDNISIGSKEKSQQPAVVGDDNKKALEMMNNTINSLFKLNEDLLKLVSQAASSSPYTKHLSIPLKKLGKELKELSKSHYDENDEFFPETLSEVVTIDKTNENEE